MAGINVLSDTLKVGSKLEKTSTSKGKDVADSPENAATGFAAMLGGRMTLNADPKGQNSKAGQDSEKKQSTVEPVQSTQSPKGLGSMLGYGIFALPFLEQMLQSDLPAGKEANSGNDVSQGTETMLKLLSLASDEVTAQSGMTTPKPQGANPAITELDKYKQVIADFLVALSGEITDKSPQGISLGSESTGTNNLSQDMAKIVQGWMTVADEVANSSFNKAFDSLQALFEASAAPFPKGTPLNPKKIQPLLDVLSAGIGTVSHELNAKASTLLAALYPILSQGGKDAKTLQGVNGMIDSEGGIIDPAAKESSEFFMKLVKGTDSDLVAAPVKDTAFLTNVQQKSDGMVSPKDKISLISQGAFREEVQKADSMRSTEVSGTKDGQDQTASAGIGVAGNLVATNVADGKTVSVPVWEQISTAFREQITNRHQELKELDIQLHPADLGKIQIGMRWENGQVHLVVQASEAATGQLLQNQLSDLRQNLTNQGVNCGMLQMGQGGERQQQNPHGDESQKTFNQNTHPNEDEDLIPLTNPLSLGRDEINRINVTA